MLSGGLFRSSEKPSTLVPKNRHMWSRLLWMPFFGVSRVTQKCSTVERRWGNSTFSLLVGEEFLKTRANLSFLVVHFWGKNGFHYNIIRQHLDCDTFKVALTLFSLVLPWRPVLDSQKLTVKTRGWDGEEISTSHEHPQAGDSIETIFGLLASRHLLNWNFTELGI